MASLRLWLCRSHVVFAVSLFMASPAFAAATADELCAGAASAAVFPTEAELLQAANSIEQSLRQQRLETSALGDAIRRLEVPASSPLRPSGEALARYCTAAGEVMRLSVEGSQLQAQTYLVTALRESRGTSDPQLTAQAAYRLGLVSLSGPPVGATRGGGRRLRRSGTEVARSVRTAQQLENEAPGCSTLDQSSLNDSSNAALSAVALDCASRLALESGNPGLSALASLRLARLGLAWAEGSSDDPGSLRRLALEAAIGALPVAERVTDSSLRSELIGRLVGTAIDLGGAGRSEIRQALAAMRASPISDPASLSLNAALEARVALASGDRDRAQALLQQAILHEAQRPLPMRLPDHYLLLAEAQPESRELHVFSALTSLENMRPLLPRNDALTEESIFSLHMRNVFETAVDVQLASGSGIEGDRIRTAQRIVEAYRQAELLNAVGSECLPPRNPVRPEDLAANEVLLYPLLLRDRVELIYVSGRDSNRGQASYRRLPPNRQVNRQEIARLVEELVLSMSYGQDEEWRVPARRLYDLLILPIEDQLGEGVNLAIIPDGPLRSVPFASLVSADGRFLVQRTAVSVAPALAYSQPGGGARDEDMAIVAASLEQPVSLPAGNFAALAGTAEEAQIAADNGSPGRHLEDFRKADLVAAFSAEQPDILHLATHASFNGRSDRAFIVANGEAIRISELRDLIAGNRTRGEPLDLLVLSACETAVGDDEASMGLAGAAVQAGALSAIASLWQVDDSGTAELMRQFYGRYQAASSRSDALRQAQLALVGSGGDNARPNVWAAFTLLGAWR